MENTLTLAKTSVAPARSRTLDERLTRLYLSQLLATPEGRAHVLGQVSEAESSGEGEIFESLAALVEQSGDDELARLIRRHQADEVRHGELFAERLRATGVTPEPVPSELKIIDRLDRALDGQLSRPVTDRLGVLQAYLVLQVIEERATSQFTIFIDAFREAGDEETAQVFEQVAKDEERHLRYCHAIAKRYAPDPVTHRALLDHYRRVEAQCFSDNSRANMAYTLDRGFVGAGVVAHALWRGLQRLNERFPRPRMTRFARAAA